MTLSRILISAGIVLILAGLALKLPFVNRLGRLPGDIAIERENFRFYFPVMSSVLVSVLLSLVFYFFGRRGQ